MGIDITLWGARHSRWRARSVAADSSQAADQCDHAVSHADRRTAQRALRALRARARNAESMVVGQRGKITSYTPLMRMAGW